MPSPDTQCTGELEYPLTVEYLIFDPAISSRFKLVWFMFGTNMTLLHTYSSESRVWSGRSTECWSDVTIQTWVFSATVNGMQHLVAALGSDYQVVIVAVDEDGVNIGLSTGHKRSAVCLFVLVNLMGSCIARVDIEMILAI